MSPDVPAVALGLSLGDHHGGGDPGPTSSRSLGKASTMHSLSPIVTQEPEPLEVSASRRGSRDASSRDVSPRASAHHSIPPPPSPRRHRSTTGRGRGLSGATISSSKSWGDLASSLAMTASPIGKDTSPAGDERIPLGQRSASDGARLPDDYDEEASYDNSARFYYRMHSASRSGSPTRSTSVSPSGHSGGGSGTSSPLYARRSLNVPPAGTQAGASLSASLSPSSRFLQQHLPPTFPAQTSPESDSGDPLAHSAARLSPQAHVILTPTTQEWRELKEIGRREAEIPTPLPEVDTPATESDSSSSSVFPKSDKKSSDEVDYFNVKEKIDPADIEAPSKPIFNTVITAPSPLPAEKQGSGDDAPAVPAVVILQEGDGHEDDMIISAGSGFSAFGRKDSLKVKKGDRKGLERTKTKRELERERLFKMVDEEIADEGPSFDRRFSWSVQEIGSGGGLDSRGSNVSLEPDKELEPHPPEKAQSLPEPKAERPTLLKSPSGPAVPIKPSPLQREPITGLISGPPSGVASGAASGAASAASSPGEAVVLDSPEAAEEIHPPPVPETENARYEAIRNYARSFSGRRTFSRPGSRRGSFDDTASPPRSPRSRDHTRISLVAGRVVQPLSYSALAPLTAADPHKIKSLQSFSPFRPASPAPARQAFTPIPDRPSISYAPSIVAPSECGTPTNERAGGVGGRGIDDYVILKEAGKGAYGLVMRAKVKGPNGEPMGDEVIIKYIIKSRILADCWKKHKVLGPIPVEIHVMDQVRHLIYHPPREPHPWDPFRDRPEKKVSLGVGSGTATPSPNGSRASTPGTPGTNAPTQKYIGHELKHAPERGHPSVCKLLDFFEDREFYYLVMPRYGNGVDLFDHVESHTNGLAAFEVRSLVGQLTDAVRFLHTNGIVHRDIKDENVILDGEGRCQLIDFGSAAHWRPGKRWDTFSGTLHYASPEILRGEMYGGKEQDVWALGTVAYVLLVGETPFAELPDEVFAGLVPGSRAVELLEERCGGVHADEGREDDGGGALGDAADLVRCCLAQEVADRPTADHMLQHRYLVGAKGWTGHRGWEKKR